jgi:hypothetical protein
MRGKGCMRKSMMYLKEKMLVILKVLFNSDCSACSGVKSCDSKKNNSIFYDKDDHKNIL